MQQRPGRILPAGAIASAGVSRVHVHVEPRAGGVALRQLGRRALRVKGVPVQTAELSLGDTREYVDDVRYEEDGEDEDEDEEDE